MSLLYRITEVDEERAIVELAEIVDDDVTPEADDEISRLLATHLRLVFDLSQAVTVASVWLRFIQRLSRRAKRQGRAVIVSGMRDNVAHNADLLAVRADLTVVDDLDAAWALP